MSVNHVIDQSTLVIGDGGLFVDVCCVWVVHQVMDGRSAVLTVMVLWVLGERSGAERRKRFAVVSKVELLMGKVSLEEGLSCHRWSGGKLRRSV